MPRLLIGTLALALAACGPTAEAPPEVPVGVEVGDRSPPLRGVSWEGEEYALDARAPRVLVFYRSAHCGLCRVQLQGLQDHLAAYEQQGVRVVAVTLDPPALSQQLRGTLQLGFDLVSVDTATFETWRAMDEATRRPVPATYVVDRAGLIQFRQIGRNAADRATDADVLTVLGRLHSP